MTMSKANLIKTTIKIRLNAMIETENKSIRTLDSRTSKRIFQPAVVRWLICSYVTALFLRNSDRLENLTTTD